MSKIKKNKKFVKSFMGISKIKKCHKDVGTSKIGLATEQKIKRGQIRFSLGLESVHFL